MSKEWSNNPLVQQLQLLMTGYGYNFYDRKNQARADDLLVRQKAAGTLREAAQTLVQLEGDFHRKYIPPPTRENPYPPAELLDKMQAILQLKNRLSDLATRISGMPVPTQDKTWGRFREELPLLSQLLGFDYQMVFQTEQLYQAVRNLSAQDWYQGSEATQLEDKLEALERLVRERQRFLQLPG